MKYKTLEQKPKGQKTFWVNTGTEKLNELQEIIPDSIKRSDEKNSRKLKNLERIY